MLLLLLLLLNGSAGLARYRGGIGHVVLVVVNKGWQARSARKEERMAIVEFHVCACGKTEEDVREKEGRKEGSKVFMVAPQSGCSGNKTRSAAPATPSPRQDLRLSAEKHDSKKKDKPREHTAVCLLMLCVRQQRPI